MSVITTKLLTSYLLMPLLGILFGFLVVIISKKNKLLSSKKLIFYILLSAVILAVPALLGFINYWFMPYLYIILQVVYLLLGIYNMQLVKNIFPKLAEKPFYVNFSFTFVITFIGAAFFSLVFNLLNELQYGLWASTCLLTFMFPPLFYETYKKYMDIPVEIYKIWKYSDRVDLSSFELMNYDKLMVIEIEVFKNVNDKIPTKIKAKTPDNMAFGIWFQKFLHDYNQKFPSTPIQINDEEREYGWIFYYKRSFFHFRKYIDYDRTVAENNIKEKFVIVAKRVLEEVPEIQGNMI